MSDLRRLFRTGASEENTERLQAAFVRHRGKGTFVRPTSRKAIIAGEQKAVDRAYDCYEASLAEVAKHRPESAAASGKDSLSARQAGKDHAAALGGLGKAALVISRVDARNDDASGPETYYVGRRTVHDPVSRDLVVVSWTNPIAVEWRNARPSAPGNVLLRRQLRCTGRTVDDYFDEITSTAALPDGDEAAEDPLLYARPQADAEQASDGVEPAVEEPRPGAPAAPRPFVPSPRDITRKAKKKPHQVDELLLRELHRSRSGRMRDIVETIRREQMALVTGAPEGVLIVQGGPGTGKSAVGLHRVTWLVDNRHFGAEEILVVGPHQGFLDYVGRVLPTLGTQNVNTVHLARLWEGDIRATDTPEVRRVKSDERMAEVLRRRVEGEWRPDALSSLLTAASSNVDEPVFVVRIGSTSLRLPRSELMGLVNQARNEPGAYRARRDRFRSVLVDRLHKLLVTIAPRRGRDAGVRRDLERNRQVVALIERIWPTLSPEEALRGLFDSPDRLRRCASGILDDDEQALLIRPRAAKAADEPWTIDDLVCLEELRLLIAGESPQRHRHIIVDEAQDLTPMQARSLRRRCPDGSMTVVGDLAQATGPHAYDDWERLAGLLAGEAARRVEQLNVSYRVPLEIMDFVHPLARHIAPTSLFPLAVRGTDSEAVRLVPTTPSDLLDATVAGVLRLIGADDRRTQRSIAVVVPDGSKWKDQVSERIDQTEGITPDARASVFVLDASQAKGMEFDHVLVLDPTAIADDGPAGLRQLYVALTRSTQSLTVLHTSPLPAALTGDSSEAPVSDVSSGTSLDENAEDTHGKKTMVDATDTGSGPERPAVGDTLAVQVVGRGTGGVWRVRPVSAEVTRPLHLVVRHGSAPPTVGDVLECWVEREEGHGYRLSASDFGRRPFSAAASRRYAAALDVLPEIAADGISVSDDAAARLAELKAMVNGCLNRDRPDWLTVWRLLGSPDTKRLTLLRDIAQRTREAIGSGQALVDLEFMTAYASWTDALSEARESLRQTSGRADPRSSDPLQREEPSEDVVEPASPQSSPEYGGIDAEFDDGSAQGPHEVHKEQNKETDLKPADLASDEAKTAPVVHRVIPAEAFVRALTVATASDRLTKRHEAVLHHLKGALLWEDFVLTDSPVADLLRSGPDGLFLYKVLGTGLSTYPDLRTGATRLLEANHTLPRPADRLYLVCAEPPAEDWSADTLRDIFGVHLLWRTRDGWGGDDIERALGNANSRTA